MEGVLLAVGRVVDWALEPMVMALNAMGEVVTVVAEVADMPLAAGARAVLVACVTLAPSISVWMLGTALLVTVVSPVWAWALAVMAMPWVGLACLEFRGEGVDTP